MTPRSRKTKGKLLEKDTAQKIKEAFSLTSEDIRVTVGSETGMDIKLNAKARARFPFSVECKRRAKMETLYSWYEQAKKQDNKLVPLVVIRADYKNSLVMLDFDYFLTLISGKPIKIKGE